MYEQLLNFGIPLSQFQIDQPESLFPPCPSRIPQFLMQNLLDSKRKIRLFENDPQASIRVFYFQFLKLCFQIEETDYQTYIGKIEEILSNPDFNFLFPNNNDDSIYNDSQFKRLIIQFMETLDNQDVNIQNTLSRFPIMDDVFILLIRTILIINKKCLSFDDYIPREELFQFLASYFGVDIALYDNCLKFIDSDVFLYEENSNQVYLIYIDKDDNDELDSPSVKEENSSQSNISSVKQIMSKVNLEEMEKDLEIPEEKNSENKSKNQRQIQQPNQNSTSNICQFIDYTYSKNSQERNTQKESFKFVVTESNLSQNMDLNVSNKNNYNDSVLNYRGTQEYNKDISSDTNSKKYKTTYDKVNGVFVNQNPSTKDISLRIQHLTDRNNNFGRAQSNQFQLKYSNYTQKLLNYSPEPVLNQKGHSKQISNVLSQEQTAPSIRGTRSDLSDQLVNKYESNQIKLKKIMENNNYSITLLNESIDLNHQRFTKDYINCLANITNEFTDSILLKKVKQPCQTNIMMMKTRARAQRNAIQMSTNYYR